MDEIEEIDVQKVKAMIEKEFPNDPALQQIHIARKIISEKAKLTGLSFPEYVKLLAEQFRKSCP